MSIVRTLKETGKSIGAEIGQALDSVSEGRNELLSHSGHSNNRFAHVKHDLSADRSSSTHFPRWSMVAGELEEKRNAYFIHIELPGMDKEDCEVILAGNSLCIRGEKRLESGTSDNAYHRRERAYGSFQRTVDLPPNVELASCSASFSKGVLTVLLPIRSADELSRRIPVS